jgi:hypothetical protein
VIGAVLECKHTARDITNTHGHSPARSDGVVLQRKTKRKKVGG